MKRFENHFTNPLYIFVLLFALSSCGKDAAKQKAEKEAIERIARYKGNIEDAEVSLDDFGRNSSEGNAKKIANAFKTLTEDMEALLLDLGITSELLKEVASRDGNPQLSEAELGELRRTLTKKKLTLSQRKELALLKDCMNTLLKIKDKRQEHEDRLFKLAERDVEVREKREKAFSSYLSFRKVFSTVTAMFGAVIIVVAQVLAAIIVTR